MGDESTTPTGTQVPEEILSKLKERGFEDIDSLLADRDTIAEERDNFKERHENAEKLVQRQGSELGQLRKITGKKPGEAQPQAGDTGNTEQPTAEQQLASVEASLTPKQKEAAEAAFKNASDEEKMAIARDPAAKLALMNHAAASVQTVPETLFGSPSNETSETSSNASSLDEDRIKELFQQERKKSSFYPSGSGGNAPTGGSGGDKEQLSSPRPVGSGGVLARIERDSKRR